MIRKTLLLALVIALCLFLSDPAWSAPPQINEIALRRTARGDVESHDRRLQPPGNPRLVARSGFVSIGPRNRAPRKMSPTGS